MPLGNYQISRVLEWILMQHKKQACRYVKPEDFDCIVLQESALEIT